VFVTVYLTSLLTPEQFPGSTARIAVESKKLGPDPQPFKDIKVIDTINKIRVEFVFIP